MLKKVLLSDFGLTKKPRTPRIPKSKPEPVLLSAIEQDIIRYRKRKRKKPNEHI